MQRKSIVINFNLFGVNELNASLDPDSVFVSELTKAQVKMRIYLAKLLANSPSTDDVLQSAIKFRVKRKDWNSETIFLKWAYRVCFFQVKAISVTKAGKN